MRHLPVGEAREEERRDDDLRRVFFDRALRKQRVERLGRQPAIPLKSGAIRGQSDELDRRKTRRVTRRGMRVDRSAARSRSLGMGANRLHW